MPIALSVNQLVAKLYSNDLKKCASPGRDAQQIAILGWEQNFRPEPNPKLIWRPASYLKSRFGGTFWVTGASSVGSENERKKGLGGSIANGRALSTRKSGTTDRVPLGTTEFSDTLFRLGTK
jgi:hypothetical protein